VQPYSGIVSVRFLIPTEHVVSYLVETIHIRRLRVTLRFTRSSRTALSTRPTTRRVFLRRWRPRNTLIDDVGLGSDQDLNVVFLPVKVVCHTLELEFTPFFEMIGESHTIREYKRSRL